MAREELDRDPNAGHVAVSTSVACGRVDFSESSLQQVGVTNTFGSLGSFALSYDTSKRQITYLVVYT